MFELGLSEGKENLGLEPRYIEMGYLMTSPEQAREAAERCARGFAGDLVDGNHVIAKVGFRINRRIFSLISARPNRRRSRADLS